MIDREARLAGLRERLARQVQPALKPTHRGPLSDHDRCTIAAYEAVMAGDLDEAELQLQLRNRPKWASERECQRQYDAVMREKNGARA